MSAQGPLSNDDPRMIAWKMYSATPDYANSKGWALQIQPMVQAGWPDADRIRRFEIMPLEQRERHVEGSLWAAFQAGYAAAMELPALLNVGQDESAA